MRGAVIDLMRLAKLCGLFGSDHAGERANAAAAADKLVRQAGLRWPDVIRPPLPPPPGPAELADAREAIAFCRRFPAVLTQWESGFLASVAAQQQRLTRKQLGVLTRIVVKVRVAAGGRP